MSKIYFTLYTQEIDSQRFLCLLEGGKILKASGLINTRWAEFSALDLAKEASIDGIQWVSTADDSVGSISFEVDYPAFTKAQLEDRFRFIREIEDIAFE